MSSYRNTTEGATWGLIMGSLLSVWLFVLAIINGSLTFATRSGEQYYVPTIVAVYLLGGSVVGGTFGALRGLLRWRVGAVVVGALAAIPLAIALQFMQGRFAPWGRHDIIFVAVFSIAFGGGGGLIVRGFLHAAREPQ